jgi:hypothetical protein
MLLLMSNGGSSTSAGRLGGPPCFRTLDYSPLRGRDRGKLERHRARLATGQFFPNVGDSCSIVAEPRELTTYTADLPFARTIIVPGNLFSTSLNCRCCTFSRSASVRNRPIPMLRRRSNSRSFAFRTSSVDAVTGTTGSGCGFSCALATSGTARRQTTR